jgi:3-phenylpropionate/trans-cinnamate dioxygenase ferredoxin reductase component
VRHVAVVGASLAGWHAVRSLRKAGFDGRLTVIGAEPHRPYDRPPLSKDYLSGKAGDDRLQLPGFADADALDLEWRLGVGAAAFDAASRTVTLTDGSSLTPDGVVIATGAVPRLPPGLPDHPGISVLRSVDDARHLRDALAAGPGRVVVIGAGFIGAEVAASCRGLGLDVTLIEALPVPLGRALGPVVGAACAEVHRDHGVDLRTGVAVNGIDGDLTVHLDDGTAVAAGLVVVGIGVAPSTGWLEGSGLLLDDGVRCDAACVAAPAVVAAGDVARWPNQRFDGEVMRVEHWDNAIDMGGFAGRRLMGFAPGAGGWDPSDVYAPVPWFWSDQYDRKLQLAGRVHPDDEVRIVAGSVEERRFAAIYGRRGRLTGVFGMNRPRQVMQFRTMVADGASWDDAVEAASGLT